MKEPTPMMAQYRALKMQYPDALLFFRLGDFYEMFFEDAEIGSRELGIVLTGRDAGLGERAPMCGVPHHSVDQYIKALIDKGYKVAICEQLEDPALAKGLVKRGVVRIITPGTYWEGASELNACYVACVYPGETQVSITACDLATGEILVGDIAEGEKSPNLSRSLARGQACSLLERVLEELMRLSPREILLPSNWMDTWFHKNVVKRVSHASITSYEAATGEKAQHHETVQRETGPKEKSHPETQVLSSSPVASVYGSEGAQRFYARASKEAQAALTSLLEYVIKTQMVRLTHLKEPVFYLEESLMEIDPSTRRNLELFERLQGDQYGSLFWAVNRCCTSMGSRLLREWLSRPLRKAPEINARLDAVEEMVSSSEKRARIRKGLSNVRDIERLVARISYGTCDARDLVALASSLTCVPAVRDSLKEASSEMLCRSRDMLDDLPEVVELIKKAIVDDPPALVTEGGVIRDGYSSEIDELRDLALGGKNWVMELEARERERTGIKNLRVGYNRVFGYYIEVTRANASLVPQDYIRRQTLASAERFVTPELKEKETMILGAEEKLKKEEYRLFCEIRDRVAEHIRTLQRTARALAEIDVIAGLAELAYDRGYVRPKVYDDGPIQIEGGRHPVLELLMPNGTFVPNDLLLSQDDRVHIITGPNMGGKSTYCRQNALIIIMAQIGSFVPCSSCKISCVDKVFARVGAYDDIVLGQSTFMVEMAEVSRILRNITQRSFVILDEIGRGTSTFDGLAVAWSVVEYLAEKAKGAKALVATHYRELTLISDLKPGISNWHVKVKKSGDEVVFLRQVGPGVSEGSFGIEVAAMAGLPETVVKRAKEILFALETEARKGARWRSGILGQVASRVAQNSPGFFSYVPGQALLLPPEAVSAGSARKLTPGEERVLDEVRSLDPNRITPMEALERLYKLRALLEGEGNGDKG